MVMNNKFRHRKKALFYEKIGGETLRCTLCPKYCRLEDGETGSCRVRANRRGVLYSLSYGWIRALNMEKIEKVPLMEYYNTMTVLAIGSWGCNMTCNVCNQRQLVETMGMGRALYPDEITDVASKLLIKDCVGIAHSYGEPSVNYEYTLETCKSAKHFDMLNILSTNGCLNQEPLLYLLPHLDAVNLDIKSMNSQYYESQNGDLETVLDSARLIMDEGVHLEISKLMIPGVNDSREEITELAMFIENELGKDVPLHLLEHIPNTQINYIRTPESDLTWAADLASKHLNNVYISTP